jgi:hypothetical protein
MASTTTTNSINENSPKENKVESKPIIINKYSIHEMKAAIDSQIIEILERNQFKEHNLHTNLKIIVGLFCIFWTGLAYLYPKPFPENYNLIILCLIFYGLGSALYYYLEKYVIKSIFYTGSNENYITKLRYGKKEKLESIRLSSEIKEYSHIYNLGFELITLDGRIIPTEKVELDCTKLCDEMGYVNSDLVSKQFKSILDDQLTHKLI